MALPFFKWSRTAALNASADPTVNFAEGQTPSSLNDSCRAMMASNAAFRDDISGAVVTGGTSTAYTVSSYQVFDNLSNMNGAMIAFTPHATNGATVTMNVDSLGAKPLRPAPGIELASNSLILGTPYTATYNNSDAVWYLHNNVGTANAYSIPLGAGMDYWGSTTPSSIFAFPAGQAISRTTYATLFSLIGTTYGAGDTSTTFNLPDKIGRVSAMKSPGGASRLTTAGSGVDSATLGAAGGGETSTLLTANLPPYTPSGSVSTSVTIANNQSSAPAGGGGSFTFYGPFANQGVTNTNPSASSSFAGNNQGGTSTPVRTVQPTIVCNYILRVLTVLLTLHASVDMIRGWAT